MKTFREFISECELTEAYQSPPVNKMKRQAAKKKIKALGHQMKSAWQGEEGRKKSMDKSDELEKQSDRIEKEIGYTRNLQDVEDLSRHRKKSDDRKKSNKVIGSPKRIQNKLSK